MAHKWVEWLCHLCHLGGPNASMRGDKIRSGPQVGGFAMSPLPYGGSPTLRRGTKSTVAHNYATPAISVVPNASLWGTKSAVANKWADWLLPPGHVQAPHRLSAGHNIRSCPQVGGLATLPVPYRWFRFLSVKGHIQQWHTSGWIGYITPAIWGGPQHLWWCACSSPPCGV